MGVTECDREPEVLDAVAAGQWPDDLRSHASHCVVCTEVATVASLFREAHHEATDAARLPTAGQVWWRATMRTRAEAALAAARPITMFQALAGACAAGAFAALITLAWSSIEHPLAWMASWSQTAGQGNLLAVISVAVVVGVGVILTPLVFYFVLSDE